MGGGWRWSRCSPSRPLLPGGSGRVREPDPAGGEPDAPLAAARCARRSTHIGSTLDRVERFDQKLRTAVTLLSDPAAEPRHGPVGERRGTAPPAPDQFTQPPAEARRGPPGQAGQARAPRPPRQEQSLQELQAYFQDQKSLLASTPSIWPARGWVTSRLRHADGPVHGRAGDARRASTSRPRTARRSLAPSDGTVVFAGARGRLRQRAGDRPRLRHQDPLRPPVRRSW